MFNNACISSLQLVHCFCIQSVVISGVLRVTRALVAFLASAVFFLHLCVAHPPMKEDTSALQCFASSEAATARI